MTSSALCDSILLLRSGSNHSDPMACAPFSEMTEVIVIRSAFDNREVVGKAFTDGFHELLEKAIFADDVIWSKPGFQTG